MEYDVSTRYMGAVGYYLGSLMKATDSNRDGEVSDSAVQAAKGKNTKRDFENLVANQSVINANSVQAPNGSDTFEPMAKFFWFNASEKDDSSKLVNETHRAVSSPVETTINNRNPFKQTSLFA